MRVRPSSATLEVLLPQLDQFGISRIADLTYLDSTTNLYVYSAIRPSAKSLTTSMGKGTAIVDAQCSALLESIETYYAEEIKPNLKKVSFAELRGKKYRVLNTNDIISHASISENFPMDWCSGKLLCSEKEIKIPHCLLSLDSSLIIPRLIGQNSDGLASGNSLEEALIYSFWELNERSSIFNAYTDLNICENLISKFISNSLSVNFYLHENIFNIPVVSCHLTNKSPLDNNKIFAGYACRSNIEEAVHAALFEAIQSKTGIISGVRDDITNDNYLFSGCNPIQKKSNNKIEMKTFKSSIKKVSEEIIILKDMLFKRHKDLAYYCYVNDNITIVKSFLVNR